MSTENNDQLAASIEKIKAKEIQFPDGYKPSKHKGHSTSFSTTRSAVHRGQKIRVRTTYSIEIDDQPLSVHTMVMDDGTVHCHGLPNYSFPSAIDLARAIIDAAPLAKIEVDELGETGGGHGESEENNHGGHH